MLVIKIKSGLGNQMFQYALYIALKEKGKKVILDTTDIYKKMKSMERNTIFDVFCLDHDYVINNKMYNFLKQSLAMVCSLLYPVKASLLVHVN